MPVFGCYKVDCQCNGGPNIHQKTDGERIKELEVLVYNLKSEKVRIEQEATRAISEFVRALSALGLNRRGY